MLHDRLENVLNIKLEEKQSLQCTLPINMGGVSAFEKFLTALPAFLSPIRAAKDLFSQILP